jgi:hypothetical protein
VPRWTSCVDEDVASDPSLQRRVSRPAPNRDTSSVARTCP